MAFQYSTLALDSKQLRVLRPISTVNERILKFEILDVPRGSAPLYTAVSYSWGEGRPSEVIFVNGKAFYVSVTLWSCLHYLSLHAKVAIWTHIWVDAICINQNNVTEKNSQVRLMDETYQRATCVSVWLGLVPVVDQWRTSTLEPTRTFDVESFEWVDYITELANRHYWRRVWVVQEFLLGGNVEIYCGGNRIDWLRFRDLVEYETSTNLYGDTDYLEAGNTIADSCAALPLLAGRHPDKHPELLRPLHELLVEHHRSKSRDPRDRVFALLGLVRHDERAHLQKFFPEYSLSEEHVATITLAHVLFFHPSPESITVDSDGLFLGLGIQCQSSRRRLLIGAQDFDYIGCDRIGEFLAHMALTDFDQRYSGIERGYSGTDRDWEAEADPTTRSSAFTKMMIILILGLGVWTSWHVIWR